MAGAKIVHKVNCTITKVLSLDGSNLNFNFGLNDGTNQLTPNGAITFGSGTGAGNVNGGPFCTPLTVPAGTTTQVNLRDGSVADIGGAAVVLSKVKYLFLSIETAGGTINFGPQGLSNAIQLNYHGVSASDYLPITTQHVIADPTGWVVDASHCILGLNNPGASSVNCILVGAGEL